MLAVAAAVATILVTSAGAPLAGPQAAYQRWVDQSALPLPEMRVVVRTARPDDVGRPSIPAAAWVDNGEIVLAPGVDVTRQTVLHELGHVVDQRYLTDRSRSEIMRDMHANQGWTTGWQQNPDHVEAGAEEQFADVFAALVTHKGFRYSYVGPAYPGVPVTPAGMRDIRYKLSILARFQVQDGRLILRTP